VRAGNRPPRTIYEITEDGSREMVDWLTEMIGVPAKEYPQFLAGLSFIPALTPEDALSAFQLRANTLELQLTQIRATLVAAREAGLPRLFMVETEFEEQLIETELEFVGGLINDMTSGDLEGLDLWRSFHVDGKNPLEGVVFEINAT
jgi:DNA-binding PadR family transcriptional regulator